MSKKLLLLFLIFGAVIVFAAPYVSQAAFGNLLPDCSPEKPLNAGGCGLAAFLQFINNIIIFLLKATFFVAPLFIAYGGFVMITAGGNTGNFESGLGIIKSALIGIVIALVSYLLVTFVFRILGVDIPVTDVPVDITNTETNPNSSFGGGGSSGGGFGGGW